MIFNMSGVGGTDLNFTVVGGTAAPSNPKENTIWVNTDAEITSWEFSATQPETAAEGMVWIFTGTNSLGEFNALKKNSITVYPISAKQYVDGVWADKDAKSYIGGMWVEWTAYLYKAGDECAGITGGWTGEGYSHKYTTSVGTKNADNLYCYSATESAFKVLGTRNAIDFTNYNTLYVDGILSKYGISVHTTKDYTGGGWGTAQLRDTTGTRDVYTLDISNLTGNYYIAIWGYNGEAVRVYNMWLER